MIRAKGRFLVPPFGKGGLGGILGHNAKGLTLVELLISLALATVVLTGLVGVWVSVETYSLSTQAEMRLHHDLQSAMRLMVGDIRKAGFWSGAAADLGTGTNTNPFMAAGTDLSINGSCILLTYDADKNGSLAALNTASGDERFGYRLNGGAIQARMPTSDFNCNAAASNWENITDPSVVEVTALSFKFFPDPPATPITITPPSGGGSLTIRNVTLQVIGRLVHAHSVTRTLNEQVRVRNDVFAP